MAASLDDTRVEKPKPLRVLIFPNWSWDHTVCTPICSLLSSFSWELLSTSTTLFAPNPPHCPDSTEFQWVRWVVIVQSPLCPGAKTYSLFNFGFESERLRLPWEWQRATWSCETSLDVVWKQRRMDPLWDSRASRGSERCWGGAERAPPWTPADPQVAAPDQLFMGQMERCVGRGWEQQGPSWPSLNPLYPKASHGSLPWATRQFWVHPPTLPDCELSKAGAGFTDLPFSTSAQCLEHNGCLLWT